MLIVQLAQPVLTVVAKSVVALTFNAWDINAKTEDVLLLVLTALIVLLVHVA